MHALAEQVERIVFAFDADDSRREDVRALTKRIDEALSKSDTSITKMRDYLRRRREQLLVAWRACEQGDADEVRLRAQLHLIGQISAMFEHLLRES